MKLKILLIMALAIVTSFAFAQDKDEAKKMEKFPPYYACMTEPHAWFYGPLEESKKRFAIYKENGVDMIRVELAWGVLEPEEGKWDVKHMMDYIKLAGEMDLKSKVILGVAMDPPNWFFEKHPDALQMDEVGNVSHFSMSYSFPELNKVVDEKNKQIISFLKEAGVWDYVIYLIPSFGPAGEPAYPHPWTMGGEEVYGAPKYWGYEPSAQKDFAKQMKTKYEDISTANKTWDTDFKTWEDVIILKPGEKPGTYWNDYLLWYRDRKRDFVKFEIENVMKNAPDKISLVYVPGTGFSQADWDDAVATAQGPWVVKMMCDSMDLMTTAIKSGAWLQYTGCENEPEVARLRKYLDDNGMADAVMWGENAGYYVCAKHPIELANIIIRNRLYGLDYTHAHFAFMPKEGTKMPDLDNWDFTGMEPGNVEPNPTIMGDLKTAIGMIREQNNKIFASKNETK